MEKSIRQKVREEMDREYDAALNQWAGMAQDLGYVSGQVFEYLSFLTAMGSCFIEKVYENQIAGALLSLGVFTAGAALRHVSEKYKNMRLQHEAKKSKLENKLENAA